tara:strand:- start:1231 stop:1908 length:678 start_codon:yes stop_codon:yes gene_type:complete
MIRKMMWLDPALCDQIGRYFDKGSFIDGSDSGTANREIKRTQQLNDDEDARELWEHHFWNSPFTSAVCVKRTSGPMFVKYTEEDQGHYDFHNDAPIMGRKLRSDYVMITAINDHDEYEGGDLQIRFGSETYAYRLNKGECIFFDPNLWHRVKPVSKGERRVCVTWLETLIQDVFIRELLYDYQDLEFYAMNAIDKSKWMHDVEPTTYFNQIRYKLIRQYSSTYDD